MPILTVRCKLDGTKTDRAEMAATVAAFARACRSVARETPDFKGHAALELARLWRDQSKRSEALDLLAPMYGWFTEGLDTSFLKEAKAMLDQLA